LVNGSSDTVLVEIRSALSGANANQDIVFERCQVTDGGRNCFAVTWFRRLSILDCYIARAGSFPAAGIDVEPNQTTDPINGLVLRGSTLDNNGQQALLFNPPAAGGHSAENTGHRIEGNLFQESHANQIEFQTGSGENGGFGTVAVVGNIVQRSNGHAGFNVDGSLYRFAIAGNHFRGNPGAFIASTVTSAPPFATISTAGNLVGNE
jgi:hypothetical protein